MLKKLCKRPNLIKNKFISACLGTCGILIGVSFIYPIANFSVYITSYIHEKQTFVTMHYGYFLNLIFSFAGALGVPIGGFLENKLGFILTTLTGFIIILIANIFFLNSQNIWFCYFLTFTSATGTGISTSLIVKNLAFYKPNKKGILASGISIIITFFTGGISFLGEKIINPDGYTLTQEEEYYGYKYSSRTYLYFLLGFFTIPIGTIIFLLFKVEYIKKDNSEINKDNDDSKEKKEEMLNEEIILIDEYNINNNNDNDDNNNSDNNNSDNINSDNNNIELQNVTGNKNKNEEGENILDEELKTIHANRHIKKVIKSFRFWRLAVIQLFINFNSTIILGTARTIGALIGIDGNVLQFLILSQSGALIIIGPIYGIIVDKKGPLGLLKLSLLICSIPGILLAFFVTNTIIFISSFIIMGLGLIAVSISGNPFVMEIFGIQESVILAGIMGTFAKLSEIIGTVLAFTVSFFYTKEEIIKPFQIMYLISSALCFLGFILSLFEKMEKFDYGKKEEDLGKLI